MDPSRLGVIEGFQSKSEYEKSARQPNLISELATSKISSLQAEKYECVKIMKQGPIPTEVNDHTPSPLRIKKIPEKNRREAIYSITKKNYCSRDYLTRVLPLKRQLDDLGPLSHLQMHS
ncbi:hypothetical protein RF11_07161 [Thelohanellus kitauei]|uniref:Uncharacterized protein n=1 Tax=Thelohanellus kitauei TaxID=669202 RepID=A0A0C2JQP9_THEKT|nr:hypothetical protein RF11_07161 [Thelohanellus kitauei]